MTTTVTIQTTPNHVATILHQDYNDELDEFQTKEINVIPKDTTFVTHVWTGRQLIINEQENF